MALTTDFLEGSIVIALIGYAIAFAFQIYMLWLNIKQSKVNNQMNDLIEEVKAIRMHLEPVQKKTSKTTTKKVAKKKKK